MKKYLLLFLTFFKIGLFTFGGGYGMLSLLEREVVAKKKWIDRDEYLDIIAVAESTPGPVAINSATFIGFKIAGFGGAAAATLAVCIPSFVIIFAISKFFDSFMQLRLVACAFRGVQVCVIYLILSSGVGLLRRIEKKPLNVVIVSAVTLIMLILSVLSVNFSSVYYILFCGATGLAGYCFGMLRRKLLRRKKKEERM